MQIEINLPQILIWPRCLCTRFEIDIKTGSWAKEAGEFPIMLYGKWAVGNSFAHQLPWLPQHKCMEMIETLSDRNSYIYWCIDLKLLETFQYEMVFYMCKNFVKKVVNFNF